MEKTEKSNKEEAKDEEKNEHISQAEKYTVFGGMCLSVALILSLQIISWPTGHTPPFLAYLFAGLFGGVGIIGLGFANIERAKFLKGK